MKKERNKVKKTSRRNFIRKSLMGGVGVVAGASLVEVFIDQTIAKSSENVKVLTTSGEIMEVDRAHLQIP